MSQRGAMHRSGSQHRCVFLRIASISAGRASCVAEGLVLRFTRLTDLFWVRAQREKKAAVTSAEVLNILSQRRPFRERVPDTQRWTCIWAASCNRSISAIK